MSILFAITTAAFCALLWAFFSVARHLRRSAAATQITPASHRTVSNEAFTPRASR